ncbi:hypothetical protein cyc_03513 [Cyclospora cayetanensis]|uniref:Uncharacterized protein n=1 Tax=Cyclospora cayetanensis TaxID=88456 RepID=A0A1D3CRU1_9EIME|nr:hypothetical protein cyc_03513 [Cyclospora cayetanensis]
MLAARFHWSRRSILVVLLSAVSSFLLHTHAQGGRSSLHAPLGIIRAPLRALLDAHEASSVPLPEDQEAQRTEPPGGPLEAQKDAAGVHSPQLWRDTTRGPVKASSDAAIPNEGPPGLSVQLGASQSTLEAAPHGAPGGPPLVINDLSLPERAEILRPETASALEEAADGGASLPVLTEKSGEAPSLTAAHAGGETLPREEARETLNSSTPSDVVTPHSVSLPSEHEQHEQQPSPPTPPQSQRETQEQLQPRQQVETHEQVEFQQAPQLQAQQQQPTQQQHHERASTSAPSSPAHPEVPITDNHKDGDTPPRSSAAGLEGDFFSLPFAALFGSIVVMLVTGALAATGGTGGGAIFLAILLGALKLRVKDSIPLSKEHTCIAEEKYAMVSQLSMRCDCLGTASAVFSEDGPTSTAGIPLVVYLDSEDKLLQMTHISSFAADDENEEMVRAQRHSQTATQFDRAHGWWRRARCLFSGEDKASRGEDFLLEMDPVNPQLRSLGEPCDDYLVQPPPREGGRSPRRPFSANQEPEQRQQQQELQELGALLRGSAAAGAACRGLRDACRHMLHSSPVRDPQHHLLCLLLVFVVCCSLACHALIDRGRWGVAAGVAAVAAAAGASVQAFISLAIVRHFKAAHPGASLGSAATATASRWVALLHGWAVRCCSFFYKIGVFVALVIAGVLRTARSLQQPQGRRPPWGLQRGALLETETSGGSVELESISAGASRGGPHSPMCLEDVPAAPSDCLGSETAGGGSSAAEAEQMLCALLAAPLVGFVTGVLAGLVGIGGGLVFSPMLLLLLDPVVAVATSSACVVYTSSATTLQFLLLGRLHFLPCLVFGATAAAAAAIGCLGVHAIRGLCAGRKSYVAFLVAAAIVLATLMTVKRYLHEGPM